MGTTVVVAWVGAVTGVLGLLWQMYTHWQGRPRVRLEISTALPLHGRRSPVAGDWHLEVEVLNVGGSSITVTNWGISVPDGQLLLLEAPSWSSVPPVVVEPGGAPAKFFYPVSELRRLHDEVGAPYSRMRVWVETGKGKRVHASGGVPLA